MLAEAAKLRSENMYPALVVDLNCGLRDKELRELRWRQIDLVHKKHLTVGKSKTDAGTGRVIPLNDTVMIALEAHAAWYIRRFGECKPEWCVFPAGKGQPNDPTRADSEGCRSAFRTDVDHDSEVMPISIPNSSRSVLRL